jgi:hypothetical protein
VAIIHKVTAARPATGTGSATSADPATPAPAAHADQATFLTDVQQIGSFGQFPPSAILVGGQIVCKLQAQGNLAFMERATINTFHVSKQDADQFIADALHDLTAPTCT